MHAREPALFWQENVVAVVIVQRVLARKSYSSGRNKLLNVRSFIILLSGAGLTSSSIKNRTVEVFVSGDPRDAKKVSVTEAGRLRESKSTQFVWELRKTAFCKQKVAVSRAFHLRECPLGELPLY